MKVTVVIFYNKKNSQLITCHSPKKLIGIYTNYTQLFDHYCGNNHKYAKKIFYPRNTLKIRETRWPQTIDELLTVYLLISE